MKGWISALAEVFERPRSPKKAPRGAQNRSGDRVRWLTVAVAGLMWVALVVYPLSLTELDEPLVPLAVGSGLCLGAVLVVGRWAFAVAATTLWIVEYASALAFSGRTDLAAPVLGVLCWLALELVDWRCLNAQELRRSAAQSVLAGAVGGTAALACLGAGLLVGGTVPVLVALGAAGGIGVLILAVALARRALTDPYAATHSGSGLQ